MNYPRLIALIVTLVTVSLQADTGERTIRAEVLVAAPIEQVWAAWTTEEGVRSFFAPGCHIDTCVDGAYEIYFLPEAPAGSRGGDGMRIMVLDPPHYLAFTWNAPPHMNWVRSQRTHVMVRLFAQGEKQTRVLLVHDGWGEGQAWDEAYAYFDRAWKMVVLPRLQYRFRVGPIDWQHPPEN